MNTISSERDDIANNDAGGRKRRSMGALARYRGPLRRRRALQKD